MRSRLILLVVVCFSLLILSTVALALGGDPETLFTDNITATGTTLAVTEMEQELLNRLNNATTSMNAAIYGLDRASVVNALIAAHNRGVTVRIVADDDAYNDYNSSYAALQSAGIPIVLDSRSSLMHNMFFVIDGQIVWTGSTNVTDAGFTCNHNNSLVFTSTQLADIYETEFGEMYGGLFGTAKTDNTTHTLTYAGFPLESYFSPSDAAMKEVISQVYDADESIYFAISSFTDDALGDAILDQQQSGVPVTGIFDQLGAGNQYSQYGAMCASGASVKVEDFGGLMHDKFMVIDANGVDPVVVTGSMDWTAPGGGANDENTLIIHDRETAQSYLATFQALYDALGPETLCETYRAFLPRVMNDAVAWPRPTPPFPPLHPVIFIYDIEYDPPGDDVEGEYVAIDATFVTKHMAGWTLRDRAGHVFTFPEFTLGPFQSIKVWTKAGTDTQTDLYWGSATPIWNNGGDCAYLRDQAGVLASRSCYKLVVPYGRDYFRYEGQPP
jgi:phosphatidylserine/phosphatidylglycerophosphate/cardiolipin synthase-like enzyme